MSPDADNLNQPLPDTPAAPVAVEEEDVDQPRLPRQGKLYYTIGEVALMLQVRPSLIRFWEQEFPHLRPKTNKKGDRRYKQADIASLKQVYTLVREKGYTLQGARDYIAEKRDDSKEEMIERLKGVKRLLEDIKAMLPESSTQA
jgi:DNA-binding transcriptional MerR regulator